MLRELAPAIRMTAVTLLLLGFIYPLAMTGLAQIIFPFQANGSMVKVHGRVVGSAIIGQLWTSPYYFHGRPSAAGKGYDPTATGGTNLAPTSSKLLRSVRRRILALRKNDPNAAVPIPIDLVTSSASGIDPDISPQAAYYQAPRVAAARRMSLQSVEALIQRQTHGRTWGILGKRRVNVLALNLRLERH